VSKSAVLATVFTLALAGCASPPKTTFVRADGERLSSSPTFESDLAGCRDQAGSSMLSGLFGSSGSGGRCMEEKGYVEVPEDQAEAKRAEILAKRDQERIAALPPVPESKPAPIVRRRAARTAAKPKKAPVKREARPASVKPKKPPLTNPLALPE
jgi:hypothetical protein